MSDLNRNAAEVIAAAYNRGAIADPAAWVQRVINADDPDEVIETIDLLAGTDNTTRDDGDYASLWPPSGAEADRRARLAAAAARAWTDDELYARLYGEQP